MVSIDHRNLKKDIKLTGCDLASSTDNKADLVIISSLSQTTVAKSS